MPINELRAIATFAKAVELGSLRQAALSQGVSPQAASQAVAHLEQHLGVRLLHRTTRSLALTEEGQRFLQDTQPALAALDRSEEHTSELQSRPHLVCRLLLEKKKNVNIAAETPK